MGELTPSLCSEVVLSSAGTFNLWCMGPPAGYITKASSKHLELATWCFFFSPLHDLYADERKSTSTPGCNDPSVNWSAYFSNSSNKICNGSIQCCMLCNRLCPFVSSRQQFLYWTLSSQHEFMVWLCRHYQCMSMQSKKQRGKGGRGGGHASSKVSTKDSEEAGIIL